MFVKIRLYKIDDGCLEMIRQWRNSPEVSRYMYTESHITKEQQKEWHDRIKCDETKKYWMIQVKETYSVQR